MSADPKEHSNGDGEIDFKDKNDDVYGRMQILIDFDKCLNNIQKCDKEANPIVGLAMLGKVQQYALESKLSIVDTLCLFNPLNYLRREYRAQDSRKAIAFYDDVKYCQ